MVIFYRYTAVDEAIKKTSASIYSYLKAQLFNRIPIEENVMKCKSGNISIFVLDAIEIHVKCFAIND